MIRPVQAGAGSGAHGKTGLPSYANLSGWESSRFRLRLEPFLTLKYRLPRPVAEVLNSSEGILPQFGLNERGKLGRKDHYFHRDLESTPRDP